MTIAAGWLIPAIKMDTTVSLRIPKGLWTDLEDAVVAHGRQFLTEVARSLGLPVQDVLRHCLGTGKATPIPHIWAPPDEDLDTDEDICPWWKRHGGGLWRRCPRLRLGPTLSCQLHENCTANTHMRINSDPYISALPWSIPLKWEGNVYWVVATQNKASAYREDGTVSPDGYFQRISNEEWAWVPL